MRGMVVIYRPLFLFNLYTLKELRPYQITGINALRDAISSGNKRLIFCAATGSGKTVVFLSISSMAMKKGQTVLIITESTKIYKQIVPYTGSSSVSLDAQQSKAVGIKKGGLYIAMAQTLSRRKKWVEAFADMGDDLLIINDEAHISTATNVLLKMPAAFLLGFTATPYGQKHLESLYSDIVIGAQPRELLEQGYLAPVRYFERSVIDTTGLEIKRGEYTECSQNIAFGKQSGISGLIEDLRITPYRKAMVFLPSISLCDNVAETLRSAGIDVCVVHSNTNELDRFMSEDSHVCLSVGMLTKGYDFPIVDLIILYRVTTSLALYLQMCGRGSRSAKGKGGWRVIDYGGNIRRFGTWEMDRSWRIKATKKDIEEDEKVISGLVTTVCKECGAVMIGSVDECIECGAAIIKEVVVDEVQTELREMKEEYTRLVGHYVGELSAKELSIWAKMYPKKKNHAIRIARCKGYDFFADFAAEMGYKKGFVSVMGAITGGAFKNEQVIELQ